MNNNYNKLSSFFEIEEGVEDWPENDNDIENENN